MPIEVTQAFADAAPNSIVENLYGPTELTIACTLYRYDAETVHEQSELGVVPIGTPYPNMEAMIVDEHMRPVAEGEAGELIMTGPQLTLGYWEDAEKTANAFVVPPGESRTFYRTGDRVIAKQGGSMVYLGRVDNQIKVQGYRVELGEIEALLRDIAGVDAAIALGHPQSESGADGVVGFLASTELTDQEINARLAERLPNYMQPSQLYRVDTFPLNANGKIDRGALRSQYLS